MVKFRCIASGNTVEVKNEYDIEQFRLQTTDYEEVEEEKKETPKKLKLKDKQKWQSSEA